jgi:hypothetical protein
MVECKRKGRTTTVEPASAPTRRPALLSTTSKGPRNAACDKWTVPLCIATNGARTFSAECCPICSRECPRSAVQRADADLPE